MPARQYPFIDIAVHERVREHFARGEAAILFSPDMTQVFWSNGQGANLFGHDSIYDFIDAGTGRTDASFRQLQATAAQLGQVGDHRNFLMRIASGFRSVTLHASVEIISVYPGDSAVLFTAPLDGKPMALTECAQRMLSGFDDPDTHMAVLDGDGQVIAASEGFYALGMSEQTSRALVGAASLHKDWLVKRPVATGKGNLPAAIGKLSDNPALHLLFAVETILGNLDPVQDQAAVDGWSGAGEAKRVDDEATVEEELPVAITEAVEVAGLEQPGFETSVIDTDEHRDATISDAADAGHTDAESVDADISAKASATDIEQTDAGSDLEPETFAEADAAPVALVEQDATGRPLQEIFETSDFVFNPNGRAMRFVWKIDAEGRFTEISDEFSAAVGPLSADIKGMEFNAVAERYGFDGEGRIRELLQRRDTWSGRMILWPVQGTDLAVPVDLAALPTYSRNRDFDGFRGFGIVRVADSVVDDKAIGLTLTRAASQASPLEPAQEAVPETSISDEVTQTGTEASPTDSVFDAVQQAGAPDTRDSNLADQDRADDVPSEDASFDGDKSPVDDVFQGERPVLRFADPAVRNLSEKVIQLEEHRIRGREGLSSGEQAAFREIARKLNETVSGSADVVPPSGGDGVEQQTPTDVEAWPDKTAEAAPQNSADTMSTQDGEQPVDDAAAQTTGQTPEPENGVEVSEQPLLPVDDALPSAADQVLEPTAEVVDNRDERDLAGLEPEIPAVGAEPEDYFEGVQDSIPALSEAPEAEGHATGETDSDITDVSVNSLGPDVVDYLPVALLFHNGDILHHANPEFLKLTGYGSLQDLIDDGGIDALFPVEKDDLFGTPDGAMLLIRNDGRLVPVTARLQSVRWQGKAALMMALAATSTQNDVKLSSVGTDATDDDFFEDEPLAPAIDSDTVKRLKIEVEELRQILETATDGVVIVGMDGEIRSMNRSASALFNYDESETRGKMFAMLFAHESQKAVLDYLSGLSGHGVASVLNDGREVIGRESAGGFIPLFMTMGRLSSSNGYCAVIRDITQWKRTEDELRNAKRSAETANAHKTDFLARVSHEIRTPLNAIIGFSDMMSSERLGPMGHPRYTEYAGDIGRSGRHVLDIVNDLLDISKIEAGEMDLEFTAVGLNEMVSEAVSLVQPQANSQRVIVRTSLSTSVPNVVADSRSIKQIALNILANAIRFTPSGGQIVVSTAYEANGSVVLRIRDTGVGMTRAELEQALKPFRQVTSGTRKRGDGTGLGLPLTKAMVDANRALFSISSAPSEGTLVEVTFPSQRVLAE